MTSAHQRGTVRGARGGAGDSAADRNLPCADLAEARSSAEVSKIKRGLLAKPTMAEPAS